MNTKWYEKVRKNIADIELDISPFKLGTKGSMVGRLGAWVFQQRLTHWFFRNFYPLGKLPFTGMIWAFRYQTVREVRDNSVPNSPKLKVFETPYGPEMRALLGGKVEAALGMRDGEDYRFFVDTMKEIIEPGDIEGIRRNARSIADALIEYSSGEIDAVKDLQTRVSVETCADYFGLTINNPDEFARWMMAMSAVLFSDPFGTEDTWRAALKGARNVSAIIDAAYYRARSIHSQSKFIKAKAAGVPGAAKRTNYTPDDLSILTDTLMGRLVTIEASSKPNRPNIEEIRSIMVVLATGWVPTGAAAGGNILNYLLKNKAAMKATISAANEAEKIPHANQELKCEKEAVVTQHLLEAMRFIPPINPGLPRYASDSTILEINTWLGKRKVVVPKGGVVMAAAASAMFDGRAEGLNNPGKFDPARQTMKFSREIDLQFGGFDILHYCIGEEIAKAMLTQTFIPLLTQKNLKRSKGQRGKMTKIGAFPQSLFMRFEPKSSRHKQQIITICIPLPGDPNNHRIDRIDGELDDFGNPAAPELRAAFDNTDKIHFAHISTVSGAPAAGSKRPPHSDNLLIEICIDGDTDTIGAGIAAFAEACGDHLKRVLLAAEVVFETQEKRVELLENSVVNIGAAPFPRGRNAGSGLKFYGTPDLTVRGIQLDDDMVSEARRHLDDYLQPNAFRSPGGAAALDYVRTALKRSPKYRPHLVRPSDRILAINRQKNREFSELAYLLLQDRIVMGFMAIMLWSGVLLGLIPYLTDDPIGYLSDPRNRAIVWASGLLSCLLTLVVSSWLTQRIKNASR